MKEAGAGIEPANSGFADRDLTTWLPRPAERNYQVARCGVNLTARSAVQFAGFDFLFIWIS